VFKFTGRRDKSLKNKIHSFIEDNSIPDNLQQKSDSELSAKDIVDQYNVSKTEAEELKAKIMDLGPSEFSDRDLVLEVLSGTVDDLQDFINDNNNLDSNTVNKLFIGEKHLKNRKTALKKLKKHRSDSSSNPDSEDVKEQVMYLAEEFNIEIRSKMLDQLNKSQLQQIKGSMKERKQVIEDLSEEEIENEKLRKIPTQDLKKLKSEL